MNIEHYIVNLSYCTIPAHHQPPDTPIGLFPLRIPYWAIPFLLKGVDVFPTHSIV